MKPPLSSQAVYGAADMGASYAAHRRPDPRIAARIVAAVGDGASVLNVGAGTGSYEVGLPVVAALDPAQPMLKARIPGAAPSVRGRAEALPFAAGAVEVVLSVLSLHHWTDVAAGLAELRRVARRRVVLMTWDPAFARAFWLTDYLPPTLLAWDVARFVSLEALAARLPGLRVEALPIAHDCSDGFLGAYWRRPEAYLSAEVRRGISSLAALEDGDRLAEVWPRLAADLASGAWDARYGDLRTRPTLDLGYRLLMADVSSPSGDRDAEG